jgi:hypothetical protein
MNETEFFYLERGTLIGVGTLLKVWDDEHTFNGLYEVTLAKRTKHGGFVEVTPIQFGHLRGVDESYTLGDLEDLADKKLLIVYNQS